MAIQQIFTKRHAKEKPYTEHPAHFFTMNAYHEYLRKVKNNTWKCNCQTRKGKLREFRYINNYIIEKKNYPFWFNDRDTDDEE